MRTQMIRTAATTAAAASVFAIGTTVSPSASAAAPTTPTAPPVSTPVATTLAAATAPTTVAFSSVQRLVQSTGNLYWTTNVQLGHGLWEARVHRTGKTSMPGSETVIFRTRHLGTTSIGALTYAFVGGDWYGFTVLNQDGHSRIVRFPLAGGSPMTRASGLPYIGVNRDLHTDGVHLYWHDLHGIRKMPVLGFSGPSTIYPASLVNDTSVANGKLYFARGTSVYRMSTDGTARQHVATGASTVTSVAARYTNGMHSVAWTQSNGAVRKTTHVPNAWPITRTLSGTTAGSSARSVADDGVRVLWVSDGSAVDSLQARKPGGTLMTLQRQARLGDVTSDGYAAHWAGTYSVWRGIH
jgi:hypothetical protein